MNHYQSPLNLHVVWHPDFKAEKPKKGEECTESCYGGKEYAEFIYSVFSRDLNNPLSPGVGIPVYYRSEKREDGSLKPIEFHEAKCNAIVVLADSYMWEDQEYCDYIRSMHDHPGSDTTVFFFVMDEYGDRVDPAQNRKLYQVLLEIEGDDVHDTFTERCKKMREVLAHDLCRMLVEQEATNAASKAPIKLFISHARKDGTQQAKAIHSYVHNHTKLGTFLDIRDIYVGEDIRQKLAKQMSGDTALIVIQTDEYSNRLWCQDELHQAKTRSIPMVVVNDLNAGEERSFPYLGNVPSIKWRNNPSMIIDMALMQVLRVWFAKKVLDELVEVHGVRNQYKCFTTGQTPELLDLVKFAKGIVNRGNCMVLYPDPPLSRVEAGILHDSQPNWVFATPSSLSQHLR